jgi:hypothetical protein
VLADVALIVRWSAVIALESANAALGNRPDSVHSQVTDAYLDALHDQCSTMSWRLRWVLNDLPTPTGPLP